MLLLNLLTVAAGLIVPAGAQNIPTQRTSSTTSALISTQYESASDAPVIFGDQSFVFLVDTGNSDAYVMQTGYRCVNSTNFLLKSQNYRLYANQTYHKSETCSSVPNEMFGIKYGAGSAGGLLVYEQVSIGGRCKRQHPEDRHLK
ncbi:Peptidase A1 [Penicillium digitatum]|uniref:Peptidase A1 domain-containing protein n=3 Tax=Penicillium digitatum TaxID=36651 RepID=K9FZX3_PEND2|nr:hypothetical protein PDIP_53850 [Penicillium digitatum Pd1]EKV11966.1 hypothetical protein PDIP_53850 [Penicillium digitatum Pd1]EKV14142.1 hypothetical protein PDIG_34290 [Penicillium digitatum PHI26]QQK43056.1 Peptidase A1 [Penicillium digitatum]